MLCPLGAYLCVNVCARLTHLPHLVHLTRLTPGVTTALAWAAPAHKRLTLRRNSTYLGGVGLLLFPKWIRTITNIQLLQMVRKIC